LTVLATKFPRLHRAYLAVRYEWTRAAAHAWQNVFAYKPIALKTMSYEEYWQADASAFQSDARADAFEQQLEPGATVADIGCGDGGLLARLRDRRGAQVHGFDVSREAVEKARARGIPADTWDASAGDLPGSFDYIILADCIEHLPLPEDLLDRLRSRFRKALLISIPNSCYWRYRARVLFGKFMVQWVAHPGEHLRFWSISDMHWWLAEVGFSVVESRPTWGIPVLKHLWPSMFAQNVLYVVQRAQTNRPPVGEPPEPGH
jgi:methionine biosynthesis protein MetW